MASIFSKIVAGDIPCHRVAENASFLAFLDIMPLPQDTRWSFPRWKWTAFGTSSLRLLGDLHVFSQKVALAMEDVMPCQRVGQAVIGLEVPHAHVHLIPSTPWPTSILSDPNCKSHRKSSPKWPRAFEIRLRCGIRLKASRAARSTRSTPRVLHASKSDARARRPQ